MFGILVNFYKQTELLLPPATSKPNVPGKSEAEIKLVSWDDSWLGGDMNQQPLFFEADHKMSTNQMVSENTFTPEASHSSTIHGPNGYNGPVAGR